MKMVVVSLFFLSCCAGAMAPGKAASVSGVLDSSIKGVERELVPAAEAMPEDKYSFVPACG